MELILFLALLVISLIVIAIGLFKPEHTEMALIGFVFLFLLSMNLEAGSIEYKVGTYTNNTYECMSCDQVNSTPVLMSSETYDIYDTFTTGGVLSHLTGYWMAVMSIIGFVGVLIGLRRQRMD